MSPHAEQCFRDLVFAALEAICTGLDLVIVSYKAQLLCCCTRDPSLLLRLLGSIIRVLLNQGASNSLKALVWGSLVCVVMRGGAEMTRILFDNNSHIFTAP